jgi:hypothetical protein
MTRYLRSVAMAGVVGFTGTSAQAQYRAPAVPVKVAPAARASQYPVVAPAARASQYPVTREPARVGYCYYYGGVGHVDPAHVRALGFSDNATAEQVVREIMEAIGIPVRSVTVQPGDVPNAAALTLGSTRLILYNPAFLATIKTQAGTNWASYGVMIHEIAHLLIGHTLEPGGSRPNKELEADRYAGFVLYNLRTTLDQAVSATQTLPDGEGSATHPPKRDRIQAVVAGWNEARLRDEGRNVGGDPGVRRVGPGVGEPEITAPAEPPPPVDERSAPAPGIGERYPVSAPAPGYPGAGVYEPNPVPPPPSPEGYGVPASVGAPDVPPAAPGLYGYARPAPPARTTPRAPVRYAPVPQPSLFRR